MKQIIPLVQIRSILSKCSVIAVVGLSPKENRPSYQVASFMQQAGYRIVPVNPGQTEILGETCYPGLKAIPFPVDIINIFRRSELVEPVVQDAIEIAAKVIWMQQGIVNQKAADLAEKSGLEVIMDRCISVDYQSFILTPEGTNGA